MAHFAKVVDGKVSLKLSLLNKNSLTPSWIRPPVSGFRPHTTLTVAFTLLAVLHCVRTTLVSALPTTALVMRSSLLNPLHLGL